MLREEILIIRQETGEVCRNSRWTSLLVAVKPNRALPC